MSRATYGQGRLRGDTIDRARVVRDRPYWAVITQQVVHARFPSKRRAHAYAATLNAKPSAHE